MKPLYFVFFFFCFLPCFLPAADYHLAKNGNDDNSGSAEMPFKTFRHVLEILQPGDRLLVHGGEYREKIRVRDGQGGEVGTPISILAAPGDKVHIKQDRVTFDQELLRVDAEAGPVIVDGIEFSGTSCVGVNILGNDVVLRNIILHEVNSHGIVAGGKNITIDACTVYRSCLENEAKKKGSGWPSGIKVKIGGENVSIQNCRAFNNYGEGIAVTRGVNCTVENCVAYDNFSVNIYIDNSYDVKIINNHVYYTDDGSYQRNDRPNAGIALAEEYYAGSAAQRDWGNQLQNIEIRANIIAGCRSGISYWGADRGKGGLKNVRIIENIIYAAQTSCISLDRQEKRIGKSGGNLIRDNVFYPDSSIKQAKYGWIEDYPPDELDVSGNIFIGPEPSSAFAGDSHIRFSSPEEFFAETPKLSEAKSFVPGNSVFQK